MDTAFSILHSVEDSLGRHRWPLLPVAVTLVVLAIAMAFLAVEAVTATSEETLVAPLRWLTRA